MMSNKILAKMLLPVGLLVAVAASPLSASSAAEGATTLSDTAECKTKSTSMTGKRGKCSATVTITAPDGYVLEAESVTVETVRGEDEGTACTEATVIYDGEVAIGAEAKAMAISDIMPSSPRQYVECRLSGEFVPS